MSDGLTFESRELDEALSLLLSKIVEVANGDGGDSVMSDGESAWGPIRL